MILRQVYELTKNFLEKKEELEKQKRFDEIKVLEWEVKMKIDLIINWFNYSIIQQ